MAGDDFLAPGVECWWEALKASVDWLVKSKIGENIAVHTPTFHFTRSAIPVV